MLKQVQHDTNNMEELLDKVSPFFKRNILVLSLGALGMIFFAYGLIGLFLAQKPGSDDMIFEASSQKQPREIKTIFVDIEGAVAKPGLHELPEGARMQDAFVAAGGVQASADREYVAKNLNLATKLSDGAKIYIPFAGKTVQGSGVPSAFSQAGETAELVNINMGTQAQLEALPGIGPVTAQKIIAGRPYSAVDELLSRKVVGNKVFEQIKDKITVY
ncbi:MAG: ComEA family DNA-binding protein [Candidatus Levybacteria bacterium]|nr:ComEA family DNA-binding protein [Candidatus Levybacteria bacterium]